VDPGADGFQRAELGKGKHKVHSHFDRSLESGPYTLKYRGSMW
jgi:hypothetical protein